MNKGEIRTFSDEGKPREFFQRDLPERMTEWCSLNCKDKGRNSRKSGRKHDKQKYGK